MLGPQPVQGHDSARSGPRGPLGYQDRTHVEGAGTQDLRQRARLVFAVEAREAGPRHVRPELLVATDGEEVRRVAGLQRLEPHHVALEGHRRGLEQLSHQGRSVSESLTEEDAPGTGVFLVAGAGRDGTDLVVRAAGHATSRVRTPAVVGDARQPFTVLLERESLVEGVVVDDRGAPLPGATVTARVPDADDGADDSGEEAADGDGNALGSVRGVHNFGAGDVLEIGAESGASLMIPFTRQAAPEIDLKAGRMRVNPEAGSGSPATCPPKEGK